MKRDDEDPQVVDLRRYRKAAEARRTRARPQAQTRPSSRPQSAVRPNGRPVGGGEPFLGARPRAGLILAAVVLVLAALWLLPLLAR